MRTLIGYVARAFVVAPVMTATHTVAQVLLGSTYSLSFAAHGEPEVALFSVLVALLYIVGVAAVIGWSGSD